MVALLLIIHDEEERESSLVVNFETKEVHKSSGSYGKHLPSMEWDTKNPGDSQFKSVGPKIVIHRFGSKISAMKVFVATTATMPITIPKKGSQSQELMDGGNTIFSKSNVLKIIRRAS